MATRCQRTLSAAALAAALLVLPAAAQGEVDGALVPLPSVLDFTGGAGWGVALGAGAEYETACAGADE